MRKYILIILSLVGLYSCSVTVPVASREEIVELSKEGDYIRPIKTPIGYYYNSPKDGKAVYIPIKRERGGAITYIYL